MVPDACDTRLDLHRIQLRGNDHTSWETHHASHIEAWSQWRLHRWMIWLQWPCSRRKCRRLSEDAWSPSAVPWTALHHNTISSGRSLFNRHVAVPRSTYQTGVLVELRGTLVDSLVVEQAVDALLYCRFHTGTKMGEGSGGEQSTVNPFDRPNLDIPSFSLGLTLASQSLPIPYSTSFGFSGFRPPPPPGTAGSSTPHQPISQASSSDEEEQADDMDGVQYYRFGHRVGKKTTRFKPSNWP
ncbi:hypothetical protein M9H77_35909 [Catharanthus roseus]|uniref:Uncharacterized protein n=1 Tax=Catharanthus roseus TaxID=4058 RepID=A0ACB9ZS38_CATRO|nr:hypothetical protein M9H77_35909 [Catharanthus roseus]